MNVSAFIEYLNKTKHLQLDADYYGNIEVWRQWWKGDVPDIHDQKEDAPDGSVISRRLASLRMPKHVCEDWANLLLNDKTSFQIGDAKSAWAVMSSRPAAFCGSCISGRMPTSWWKRLTGPAPVLLC